MVYPEPEERLLVPGPGLFWSTGKGRGRRKQFIKFRIRDLYFYILSFERFSASPIPSHSYIAVPVGVPRHIKYLKTFHLSRKPTQIPSSLPSWRLHSSFVGRGSMKMKVKHKQVNPAEDEDDQFVWKKRSWSNGQAESTIDFSGELSIWLDYSIFNVAPRELFLTKKDGVLELAPLASLEMPAHGG